MFKSSMKLLENQNSASVVTLNHLVRFNYQKILVVHFYAYLFKRVHETCFLFWLHAHCGLTTNNNNCNIIIFIDGHNGLKSIFRNLCYSLKFMFDKISIF